ncbi:hypothetical protein NP493_128g03021 [Ridgeia piscesae]|uniref:Eukaryotic translation initiation factor 2A n=1 Tax=Ridgeia piscesae TaxID=27915 RepID=A0AAD9P5K5_RIDPI|nr:hypothetical protein NP493_128g03021 [Ridgeia piscesae]
MTCIAFRGQTGVWLNSGPPDFETMALGDFREVKDGCKAMAFSADGNLFAFGDDRKVSVIDMHTSATIMEAENTYAHGLKFSSRGNILAVWESLAGAPNLHFYNVATKKRISSIVQKRQNLWSPQWSADEQLAAVRVGTEIHFFENGRYEQVAKKFVVLKVVDFLLPQKAAAPYRIAINVAGARGQLPHVRIFEYPKFGNMLMTQSFTWADKVEMKWNNAGTALLVLTAIKEGETHVYLMNLSRASTEVNVSTDGPVYCVEWSPNSEEFCVLYGYMPTSATLYNMQCEPIFDFGTGPRHFIYFNPQGSILCFVGFGNLHGSMEVWNMHSKQVISRLRDSDVTHFEWCPDGVHMITSKLSPQIKVSNGFKVWHCGTGKMMHQWCPGHDTEVWRVSWQSASADIFPDPIGKPLPAPTQFQTKTRNDSRVTPDTTCSGDTVTDEHERLKKVRNLKKKLQQIEKLKQQQAAGKTLELNQREKLSREEEVLDELAQLQL